MKKADFLKKAEELLEESIDDVWASRALDIINNAPKEPDPALEYKDLTPKAQVEVMRAELCRAKAAAAARVIDVCHEFCEHFPYSICGVVPIDSEDKVSLSLVGSGSLHQSILNYMKQNNVPEEDYQLLFNTDNSVQFLLAYPDGGVTLLGNFESQRDRKRAGQILNDYFATPFYVKCYDEAVYTYKTTLKQEEEKRESRLYNQDGLIVGEKEKE